MVSPSALAVLMLMTKSNLVGCSTGNSLGFSPLRDAADVNASLLVRVSEADPVAHQAARCGEFANLIDCWNSLRRSASKI
jgi:hypothetical protein